MENIRNYMLWGGLILLGLFVYLTIDNAYRSDSQNNIDVTTERLGGYVNGYE